MSKKCVCDDDVNMTSPLTCIVLCCHYQPVGHSRWDLQPCSYLVEPEGQDTNIKVTPRSHLWLYPFCLTLAWPHFQPTVVAICLDGKHAALFLALTRQFLCKKILTSAAIKFQECSSWHGWEVQQCHVKQNQTMTRTNVAKLLKDNGQTVINNEIDMHLHSKAVKYTVLYMVSEEHWS